MINKESLIVIAILFSISASVIPSLSYAQSSENMTFTYYTKWGSAGEGDGQFAGQNDVDFYDGKVYVPDYANHRIQIFDPNGNFITKFGDGGEGDGQFHKASALSIDDEGNLYIADQFNFRIQKFTSDGEFLGKWGSEGQGDGQFLHPHVPANDAQGKLFVTDRD
nr:6-bladed beta-propeller [Nitrosopumilus sp.]